MLPLPIEAISVILVFYLFVTVLCVTSEIVWQVELIVWFLFVVCFCLTLGGGFSDRCSDVPSIFVVVEASHVFHVPFLTKRVLREDQNRATMNDVRSVCGSTGFGKIILSLPR
jgi:hypothetical protein